MYQPFAAPPLHGPVYLSQSDQRSTRVLPLSSIFCFVDMDTFDNFQYDASSTYGGLPIVDDTSSIVSGFTTDDAQNRLPASLDSLSSLSLSGESSRIDDSEQQLQLTASAVDEDLDGVLDDLKDAGNVELPPHACRYVAAQTFLLLEA